MHFLLLVPALSLSLLVCLFRCVHPVYITVPCFITLTITTWALSSLLKSPVPGVGAYFHAEASRVLHGIIPPHLRYTKASSLQSYGPLLIYWTEKTRTKAVRAGKTCPDLFSCPLPGPEACLLSSLINPEVLSCRNTHWLWTKDAAPCPSRPRGKKKSRHKKKKVNYASDCKMR